MSDESLTQTVIRQNGEIDQLKQQLAQAQGDNQSLTLMLEAHSTQKRLSGWLSPDESAKLRQKFDYVNQDNQRLKGELERTEAACANLDDRLGRACDESAKLQAQCAAMREALNEAIALNHVPEHHQDDEWNQRLTKCSQALSTTAGTELIEKLERLQKRNAELCDRITDYLGNGGLWNPESMEHNKVRDLLIDCREALKGKPL